MNKLPTNRLLLLALALLFAFGANAVAQNKKLADEVKKITSESQLRHASVAVSVYNLTQSKQEFTYDADRLMSPASLMKLFTTAAGFENLGKGFRFKTSLGYTGSINRDGVLNGDLVIVGGGDPLLGSYRYRQTAMDTLFRLWYNAVRKAGIVSVNGRVVADASIFGGPQLHDSWPWGDVGNYYGCGATGLNFHENMYFVFFNADRREGLPADIDHLQPKGIDVRHQNYVTTGPANSGDHVVIYGTPTASMRYCEGTVPMGQKNFKVRGALPNPGKTCAELFSVYLRNKNISVSSHATDEVDARQSVSVIFDYYSVPYTLIAQYTNKTSNNLYAESIFKYLGYEMSGKGNFKSGVGAVNKYLKDKGLDMSAVNIVDGSGLSKNGVATSRFFTDFLAKVSQTDYYNDFRKTLPKVGESGTARNLLSGKMPGNTEVYVKTGTMSGVCSYAGYATRANGDKLCFSILVNNHTVSASTVRQYVARLLLVMLNGN
ncbi:MAG: D-alanyl-D-alanine carboxypeptidase/D-alanyl-D-alanine-endopeptidase [Bacteroidales bacterium]|nr:D-alanyl-D-alanine carboxypeptidase/D-alanyl-D-alanine-endopeptidase [Bacteroidales bacterium]